MEINITYETLFDLLRKERSLDELQLLDPRFWVQVVDYLTERSNFLERTSSLEQEKARLQLQNIKRILREIYDRREQKLVNLAINVIRTETATYIDKRNMLAEEKELFNESVVLLEKYKKGILFEVFENRIPSILPGIYDSLASSEGSAPASTSSDSFKDFSEQPFSQKSPSSSPSAPELISTPKVKSESKESSPVKLEKTIVKFTIPVPRFIGKNKEVFGPFDTGNIVQLPTQIANILIKKGKVQAVLSA